MAARLEVIKDLMQKEGVEMPLAATTRPPLRTVEARRGSCVSGCGLSPGGPQPRFARLRPH